MCPHGSLYMFFEVSRRVLSECDLCWVYKFTLGVRFRWVTNKTFKRTVSVWRSECVTDTNDSKMLQFQLSNVLFFQYITDFTKDRTINVFFRLLGTIIEFVKNRISMSLMICRHFCLLDVDVRYYDYLECVYYNSLLSSIFFMYDVLR